MNPKYVLVVAAALLGVALSALGYIVPITITSGGVPDPKWIWLLNHASNVSGFILTYMVLLGLAYWAGGRVDFGREYAWLTGVTFLAASIGYTMGFLVFVFPALSSTGESWLSLIVILLGGAVALGIKLSVVTVAGASIAHIR